MAQKYGDVDSGDRVNFRSGEKDILSPEGDHADGVAAPIGISIQLIEEDEGKNVKKAV